MLIMALSCPWQNQKIVIYNIIFRLLTKFGACVIKSLKKLIYQKVHSLNGE